MRDKEGLVLPKKDYCSALKIVFSLAGTDLLSVEECNVLMRTLKSLAFCVLFILWHEMWL